MIFVMAESFNHIINQIISSDAKIFSSKKSFNAIILFAGSSITSSAHRRKSYNNRGAIKCAHCRINNPQIEFSSRLLAYPDRASH